MERKSKQKISVELYFKKIFKEMTRVALAQYGDYRNLTSL